MDERPRVLFVCVHNAGRSQMAAALTELHGQGRIEVLSAGSEPADQVNPMAIAAMAELGIDLLDRRPKLLSSEAVRAADVVITMGCGDACPVFPGRRYLDWELDDPAGKDLATVRGIRNEINRRVLDLVQTLLDDGTAWERPASLSPD
ncbi:MAG: arsenate reductase ArsC [Acidimicrobiia bacterium]|nr:arsenate reductase ArsC [Acidimicrobiia bacterium]MBT8217005.1 arsenate reductase ArsC [Acidimicrobiia bacterium]NNF10505.1 arsenate reductase ArsC [Acidimicrobiia bacterium]NNL70273.1 arsenate reductase ArsC [Acidimicrobiia bacterium]